MKLFRAMIILSVIAVAFSGTAWAGTSVPKAPPKTKPGNLAPKVPHSKNPISQATKQGSSQGKGNSGSNYGQKVESKGNPPKK